MALTFNMKTDKQSPEEALLTSLNVTSGTLALLSDIRKKANPIFTLQFYGLSTIVAGKTYKVTFPVTITSIMKGTATASERSICRTRINILLHDISSAIGLYPDPFDEPAALPAVDDQETFTLKEFDSLLAEASNNVGAVNFADTPTVPPKKVAKPVSDGPVKLIDATQLGQPVRGTNVNSIYYTSALSERVRLAIRVSGTSISIRVEGSPNTTEKAKLVGFGMSPKIPNSGEAYYSMHLDAEDCPVPRVVGAVLLGLGIDFDEVIKNFKDIKGAI